LQTFKYRAISRDGAKVNGVVEAFDEYAAVAKIKETCSIVIRLTEVKATEPKTIQRKLNEKSLSIMCSQFSIILSAGLPIVRAVELIADQTADKSLQKILKQAAGDVSAGFSLAQSFEKKGKNLPVTFIETVRSGEESGTLESAFSSLHTYYDKSSKMKGKVATAMAYPIFTLCVAVVAVAVIMLKAVPTFVSTFATMQIELPGPTRALIAVSNFLAGFWPLLLVIILGLVLASKLFGRTERGCLAEHQQKLKIPILGKLHLMKAASQFSNTMYTMLSAGIPMIKAVSITTKVLDNRWIGTEVSKQLPKLEEGHTLASCMRNAGVLPELLVEMAGVGEETGTLEHMFDITGTYYDNETELLSQKALNLLEPIIICLLAGVVVLILLAVYLPMFSLYGSM
jgi:type IV pilus assembly protein PilC